MVKIVLFFLLLSIQNIRSLKSEKIIYIAHSLKDSKNIKMLLFGYIYTIFNSTILNFLSPLFCSKVQKIDMFTVKEKVQSEKLHFIRVEGCKSNQFCSKYVKLHSKFENSGDSYQWKGRVRHS
jgi:hypothetical protein